MSAPEAIECWTCDCDGGMLAVSKEEMRVGLLATLGLKAIQKKALTVAPVEAEGSPPTNVTGPAAGSGAGPALPDKNAAAYTATRAALQTLVDALQKHPQQARVTSEIAAAQAKLVVADGLAGAKDYANATKALADAKTICATAKKKADDWADYARARANTVALAMSFGSADFDWTKWANPELTAADALASATPPQFAAAIKHLKTKINEIGEKIVKNGIKTPTAKLALIEKTSKAAQAYMKPEIDEGRGYLAAAQKALAAKEWSLCRQDSSSALRLLGPAARACARRDSYEAQRAATVATVAKVRAEPLLKAQADALDQRLAEADKLAAHDTQQIEAGIAVLTDAAAKAAQWAGIGSTVTAHAKDRTKADADLAALDAHAAAAKLKPQRDAIRAVLANAKVLADGAPAASDPAAAWKAALAEVARARNDLEVAKKLAESLGAATAAEAAAAKPGDLKGLKAAQDNLRADAKLAAKDANAAAADAPLKKLDAALAAGDKALAASDGATAAAALRNAATALAEARSVEAARAQFGAQVGTVEAGLKALRASPRAAAVKPRVDAVDAALTDAKAKNQANAAAPAMASLRHASDALAAAKTADAQRAEYDKRAGDLGKLIEKVPAPDKAALQTSLAAAKGKADTLGFGDAGKTLDAVEVALEKRQLSALMKTPTPDPKAMTRSAAKMVAKGGAAEVDGMIQAIPDGGDINQLNALAKGRYGVTFTSEAALPAAAATGTTPARTQGDPAHSMKAVCKMFSQIPQDIVKHPSVKGVEFKDQYDDQGAGGSFSYDDAKVRMVGRTGIPQQFGNAQKGYNRKTKTWHDQLPAAIEPDCQPKDTVAVEYLSFAAAHEVGHAVDDATGFMQRHGSGVAYGEWTTYGGNVQPIADAIGTDVRFAAFYKTPAQKQYVLDTLMNKPSNPPAVTPASTEDSAKKEFDKWYGIATSADVFRRQGDCEAIKIGDYIYHEAYARQWVRYRADARKQALTGYQFRAPGEWFAELYAGYRSKKLKDTHPAMKWLTKL